MDVQAARDLISTTRELADTFETFLDTYSAPVPTLTSNRSISFDPETDEPPYRPDPSDESGTDRSKRMAYVIMFGRLWAINVRQGRRATAREVSRIAKVANYADGRAWNKWKPGAIDRDGAGERWLLELGHTWLMADAEKLGLVLPDDLAEWRAPRD